jgi:uncharacterized repeat protein (TIGR01451 family)
VNTCSFLKEFAWWYSSHTPKKAISYQLQTKGEIMREQKFILLSSLILFLFNGMLLSQITVNINSGNPAFPFPQFLSYDNPTQKLGNLATNNPVGVCHAEMEQSIRDAYQIMMNRASKTGASLNGIDYILYKSSPSCSEGDGYAMLAAAAMADKTTFDGLWLWIHDNAMNKVISYSTGQSAPAYLYSTLPGWPNTAGSNSAADGDADIALALLTAYMQWGEFMGINDSKGSPISYKHDLIEFLKGMTDTIPYSLNGGTTYVGGDIGMDGYIKGGDTWQELTAWASSTTASGFAKPPNSYGPAQQYIDYAAPSYYHEFADFLLKENQSLYAWNIQQFQRCEASSDWIMGKLLANPSMIPFAGHVGVAADSTVTFTQMDEGEDFRLAWRTILNCVWHGDPSSTWDPAAHQQKSGISNTFERDIGQRYAKFLWDTRQSPWNNPCIKLSLSNLSYWGPSVLGNSYTVLGNPTGPFFLNWIPGIGSFSAVISQDFNLMAELYRQCEILWDAEVVGDGYLTSVPQYYSDWFRLLGMLVLSGNYHAPSAIKPVANMKIYLDVDKTCAAKGDTISYALSYRNYGSVDAQNAVIIDTLPNDFTFISCTGGGIFQPLSHTLTWALGTVPGFKTTAGIASTKGEVSFKAAFAATSQKKYANKASVSCNNGMGWTSNEFPNVVSSIMKRNRVDVINKPFVNGQYSGISPLYGGRPGVHFSYAIDANTASGVSKILRFRLFHDAQEPYIDYGNYRFSIFMYDSLRKCLQGTADCSLAWQVTPYVTEGFDKNSLKIFQENIASGQDSMGKWNQRIVVKFSDPTNPNRVINLAGPDCFLNQYPGNIGTNIHRGGSLPLRLILDLHTDYNPPQPAWNDDWSLDPNSVDAEGGMYWPITNDWTDPDNPDIPVTTWNPKACSQAPM